MKRWVFISVVGLFVFWVGIGGALADEILLENGDKLTGTILKLEAGKIILQTDYAGPIEIQKDKVKKIVTDKEVKVHLTSGEVLKGRLKTTEEGKLAVEASREREATLIDWTQVVSINPPPSKWKGNVNIGANLQSGNADRANASVGAEAQRRTERDRFNIRFLHNYGEEKGEVTARNTYGSLKYDYFFTQRFYGYLAVEMLNDKFKDLHLRTITGPGVGYQIWDDDVKSLLVEAGVTYFSEDRIEAEDDRWFTARIAMDFTYQLMRYLAFSDKLQIYPSLRRAGEYSLRNEASLISPLGAGWSLRLMNIIERQSDPPPGVLRDDIYWILGLQYSF